MAPSQKANTKVLNTTSNSSSNKKPPSIESTESKTDNQSGDVKSNDKQNGGKPAACKSSGGGITRVNSKSNKKSKRDTNRDELASCNGENAAPPVKSHKNLVEELRIFQNSNLLNQEDPFEQLHQQLNELIKDDDDNDGKHNTECNQGGRYNRRANNGRLAQQQSKSAAKSGAIHEQANNYTANGVDHPRNQGLSYETMQDEQNGRLEGPINRLDQGQGGSDMFTIKKGILWQQQDFEKFHQRLFSSRWKKRYFILTTDYLVCFKRSSSKVGRSEMGKFLYKTSLGDIIGLDWLRPNRSDKGAIVLQTRGQFNLQLWCKRNLDEWMFLLKESIERVKLRRQLGQQQQQPSMASQLEAPVGLVAPRQNERVGLERVQHHHQTTKGAGQCDGPPTKLQEPISESISDKLANKQQADANGLDPNSMTNNRLEPRDGSSTPRADQANKASKSEEELHPGADGAIEGTAGSRTTPMMINDEPADGDADDQPSATRRAPSRHAPQSRAREDSSSGRRSTEVKPSSARDKSSSASSKAKANAEQRTTRRRPSGSIASSLDDSLGKTTNKSSLSRGTNGSGQATVTTTTTTDDDDERLGAGREQTDQPDEQAPKVTEPEARAITTTTKDSKQLQQSNDPSQDHNNNNNKTTFSDTKTTTTTTSEANGGQETRPQQQAPTNLIRRDDSWQSLVSLTRVGKTPLGLVAAGQRSLYAQHIMPGQQDGGRLSVDMAAARQLRDKQNSIDIESTVTPIRGAPARHYNNHQQARTPLLFGRGPTAASFDETTTTTTTTPTTAAAQSTNAPFQLQAANGQLLRGPVSYQHKLAQLQMLHNTNLQADRLRQQLATIGDNNNANNEIYQIYGPGSVATNHYGYYSMRSNLKSAASEFSFIRPSPSSHQPNQMQLQAHLSMANGSQSTLPHQGGSFAPATGHNPRSSLLLQQQQLQQQQRQYLVDKAAAAHELQSAAAAPTRELPLRPNKRRPVDEQSASGGQLKAQQSRGLSSIASFFRRAFSRRSKRKQRQQLRNNKLAESCSSSLGAFDESFPRLQVLPSAFSTGSKSIDAHGGGNGGGSKQQSQQRMVDMIEAFANKTHLLDDDDADADNHGSATQLKDNFKQVALNSPFGAVASPQQPGAAATPRLLARPASRNQFGGSPLHKSNSISTTGGLVGLNELHNYHLIQQQQQLQQQLYDNEPPATPKVNSRLAGESPLMSRPARVMSANLTPLYARREPPANGDQAQLGPGGRNLNYKQSFVLSPRNQRPSERLPRPSSIYGQPSMINGHHDNDADNHHYDHDELANGPLGNFGLHRASLHSYSSHRNYESHNQWTPTTTGPNYDGQRAAKHQLVKLPFQLDTTREVAEEVSSPTGGEPAKAFEVPPTHVAANGHQDDQPTAAVAYHQHQRLSQRLNGDSIELQNSQLTSDQLQRHQRRSQAIVNPILQSPTTSAIYDNHQPAMDHHHHHQNGVSSAYSSHYDNQHLTATGEQRHFTPPLAPSLQNREHPTNPGQVLHHRAGELSASHSPNLAMQRPSYRQLQLHQQQHHQSQLADELARIKCTPTSRHSFRGPNGSAIEHDSAELTLDMMLAMSAGKPAAIVAPSTPLATALATNYNPARMSTSASIHDQSQYLQARIGPSLPQSPSLVAQSASSMVSASASPMSSRRKIIPNNYGQQQPLCQQSPLVSNRQVRLASRPEGVQAASMMLGGPTATHSLDLDSDRPQAVVNIAGAPGINLEPALAAALLRGTNINAYECSTSSRPHGGGGVGGGGQAMSASKTFLISSRLSKTLADEQQQQQRQRQQEHQLASKSTEETNSTSTSSNSNTIDSSKGESASSTTNGTLPRPSTRKTSSSSTASSSSSSSSTGGSRGTNSGELAAVDEQRKCRTSNQLGPAGGEPRQRRQRQVATSNHNNNHFGSGARLESGSGRSSTSNSSSANINTTGSNSASRPESQQRPRQRDSRSSADQSDESGSRRSCSDGIDEPDERNWITSKLASS